MKRALLLFALALTTISAGAADYYWVNGGGNWSDLNHWRLGSSGGSIPSIVPSASDNVIFDANSGFGTTAATKTVTLDANGFCNNMTWDAAVPNSPIFTRSVTTYKVEVWGNLSLAPSVNYTTTITFKGSTINTFTTNGTVAGIFAFEVDKGTGTLSVADSFVCPSTNANNNIILTSGTLNAAGKTIKAYQFVSNNAVARTLDITGSTLAFSYRWTLTGTNKTLLATGSSITANSILTIDGGSYNQVSTNGLFDGDMTVSNATISKLTFTNVSTGGFATVSNTNTIDTVIFKGRGRIYNNNHIGKVTFSVIGNILGSKNVFGTVLAQAKLQLTTTDTTTIDSLLLAPNQSSTLAGTININQYMKAQGATCQAFTEVIADSSAPAGIYFAPGAAALIDNVLLTNINAYGNITPISVSGVDGGGNTGFNITAPASLSGTTLYWVGGAGDWNDNNHWSYTSGGPGGACIPFIADTVIFNSGSGLTTGNIVTTSGNSYCKNISWLTGVGTSTFSQGAGTHFNVYGSAVLAPAVTVNATLEFVGGDSTSTFTTNGSALGTLALSVNKPGSGALTFADNWTNANGGISLLAGHLNMIGKTVNIQFVSGTNNNTRYMDITNSNIHVTNTWAYTGSNNFISDTGSHIVSETYLNIANRYYPSIVLNYAGVTPNVFSIAQSTIDSLTFASNSATSVAQIGNGNTIRRLEFKGAGSITGNNTIDSLVLASSRNYKFASTTTINKYLQATSAACTGLIEMRGNTAGTIAFNPAAVINMSNVYLQNMAATGVPSVVVSGADAGGNSGWTINSTAGSAHYWVGGSGDWNDNTHWSATSGGIGGACVPTVSDDVYFDANSFTSASKTVTVNNGNAYARNINWAAATNAPIWNKSASWTVEAWGDSIILNSAATFTAAITAKGPTPAYLKGNVLGDFDFSVDKPGSSLTMLNDYSNAQTNISLYNGTWNASGIKLNVLQVDNSVAVNNVFAINISNATVVAPFGWRFQGAIANHSLNAVNSSITTNDFKANGMTYDTVNVTSTIASSVNMASTTIDKLTFTDPTASSLVGITGANNTIGTAEFKGGGGIYSTGNVIDTLIFFPGSSYLLGAGTNTTVNDAWYGSGTPCHLTEIYSTSTTANATVTQPAGTNTSFDYARLRRITGTGGATFSAQQHTIDLGNNTNWSIASYNAGAPITGLGNDTALFVTDFPYTLGTEGFFGVPSSQYLWSDNSTADSLVAADTGSYAVKVTFVDGCTVSDTIHLALRTALSISLINFEAYVQNCQANLNWKVTNAVNFRQFVVERSIDGRNFTELANLPYSKGTGDYAYIDKSINIGTSYYRLRLMDMDGSYSYSKVTSVKADCSNLAITVYPTVTKDVVTVDLPSGYGGAKIEVYNNAGQLVQTIDNINEGKQQLQFSGMVQGQYLLKVSRKAEVHTFKVMYQL